MIAEINKTQKYLKRDCLDNKIMNGKHNDANIPKVLGLSNVPTTKSVPSAFSAIP